ncbi:MAG: hypothetical protein R3296_11545 [Oleiphilaceae bacterium]|nr:hypothetical protein [Oleiphilaceae bacterium]
MAKKPSDDKNGLQELIQKEGDALKVLSRLDLCFEHRTQPHSKWDVRIPPYPDPQSQDTGPRDHEGSLVQASDPLSEQEALKQMREKALGEARRELTKDARDKRSEQMKQRLSRQQHVIHRALSQNHHWKNVPTRVAHKEMRVACELEGLDVKKGDIPKVTNELAKKGYLPADFLKRG